MPQAQVPLESDKPQKLTRLDPFANLSTGHLTEEVRTILDMTEHERNAGMAPDWRGRLIMMSREYGWFIYIPSIEEDGDNEEYGEIPHCLRACFDLARQDGAIWILFDMDEEMNEHLPYYAD